MCHRPSNNCLLLYDSLKTNSTTLQDHLSLFSSCTGNHYATEEDLDKAICRANHKDTFVLSADTVGVFFHKSLIKKKIFYSIEELTESKKKQCDLSEVPFVHIILLVITGHCEKLLRHSLGKKQNKT